MTTHLFPVSKTLEEARAIADDRPPSINYLGGYLKEEDRGAWDIRKDYDGYYVVPVGDPGYDFIGAFVERRQRAESASLHR